MHPHDYVDLRQVNTLIDLLHLRARQQPDQRAYSFLADGEEEAATLTYHELDRQARSIAVLLKTLLPECRRALLVYPPGLEYIGAFFGCLYAGIAAIPLYPPRVNRSISQFQTIMADAHATVALITAEYLHNMKRRPANEQSLETLQWLTTDDITPVKEDDWRRPEATSATLAFIQYTSGSASTPRGVMLSHSNLLHNLALIHRNFEIEPTSSGVSWLPPYHDMGLIGGILEPLYSGAPMTLMSPAAFLQRPFRWLEAISRTSATISGAPNFAYDLCIQKITQEQRSSLDLSHWDLAFVGAEPVRYETLKRFAETFASCGFRQEAFYPCYGLAEATLMVSGGLKAAAPVIRDIQGAALERGLAVDASTESESNRKLVGCGQASVDHKIVIVDPQSLTMCRPGQLGEIWISSPSIAQGYWNNPEETERTFRAYITDTGEGPFLRSGDMGFLKNGELFIVDRLKDLIIIRGHNHYPHDIELTIDRSHSLLPANCGAAFSVVIDGEERLVVVHEVDRHYHPQNEGEITQSLRMAVAKHHALYVYAVVLLKPGSIPRTSSGKVRRYACKEEFLNNTLHIVGSSILNRNSSTANTDFLTHNKRLLTTSQESLKLLEEHLLNEVARLLGVDSSQLDSRLPLINLGLDSLMAFELKYYIESTFGIVIPVESIIDDLSVTQITFQAFSQLTESNSTHSSPQDHPGSQGNRNRDVITSIDQRRTDSEYPLSHGQRALWFMQQLAPESIAYNLNFVARIHFDLDVSALRAAFQHLVDRHPMLRTTFTSRDGEPAQQIHRDMQVFFEHKDASSWNQDDIDNELDQKTHRPFDLEQRPLLQAYLFTRTPQEHILLLVTHHIIVDATSLVKLLEDLRMFYSAEKVGVQASLPPLELQYTDYIRWQNDMLVGPVGDRLWQYWKNQLKGDLPVLNLTRDHLRPPIQTYQGATHSFIINEESTRQLRLLAKAEGVTLYMILLATFKAMLYRYTGEEDILVGSPMSCRSRTGFEGIVGYIINPVVLRTNLSGNPSFKTLFVRVRRTVLAGLAHRDYPFSLLVERLQPVRDPGISPFFQIMFNMPKAYRFGEQEAPLFVPDRTGFQLCLGELHLDIFTLDQHAAMFDLMLSVVEVGQTLFASLQYNTDLFDAAAIARMEGHFRNLLEAIIKEPEQKLANVPLLTRAEQQQMLVEWNNTDTDFPRDTCFHQLFEAQVERTPEAIAAVFKGEYLSYRQLDQQANRLARGLIEEGVCPDSVVALLSERNLDLLTAMIAVFKVGGVYLPLDPASPVERLIQIVDQSKASLVLATKGLVESLTSKGQDNPPLVLQIEKMLQQMQQDEKLSPLCAPDDLAYIIYTSGSTGKPKGAMIQHKGMLNHLYAKIKDLHLTATDKIAQTASQCFDISIWQFLAPLLVGGSVHIFDDEAIYDPTQLLAQLKLQQISILEIVPSLLQTILDEIKRAGPPDFDRRLRWLILTGEVLLSEPCREWLHYYPDVPLLNAYGPTECSDDVTHYPIFKPPPSDITSVPIGRPIANTRLYLLNPQLQPLPIGVAGELYVGGIAVGRGYLHDANRTHEVFVKDIFTPEPGSLLYKTGDFAYYRPDGTIEFLGRMDHQVKIRGFRLELGEIEAILSQHPGVQDTLVIAHGDAASEKRLVVYLVAKQQASLSINELRSFLKEKLPDYMIPSIFIFLDSLPLNSNGKIDRRALPEPETVRPRLEESFTAPRTNNEEVLAKIWGEVLGLKRVGIHDNFFELGGDSIQGIQAISRANQASLHFTPRQFFQYQTIAELALVAGAEPVIQTEQGPETGLVPLTPVQCWFFEQPPLDPNCFSQSLLVEARQTLNPTLIERTLEKLLARHDIFRNRFVRKESGWVQESIDYIETPAWVSVDLSTLPGPEQRAGIEATTRALQDSLNITTGPVIRVALFNLGVREYNRLLFVIHHLLVDRISCRILLEDFQTVYHQFSQSQAIQLPPKTTSFKNWSEHLTEFAQSATLRQELDYWLAFPWTRVSHLPRDYPDGSNTNASARNVWTLLSAEETQSLLQEVPAAYHTQINDILLTALIQPFFRWTRSGVLLIDLEGHGREPLFEDVDLSRTVGWFTAIFPVILSLKNFSQPGDALLSVKEQLRRVPNRGIGYGLLRYLNTDTEIVGKLRALSHAELSFNYLGRLDQIQPESTMFALDSDFTKRVYSLWGNRPYLLNINVGILHSKLHVAWTYSENIYQRDTIETLARDFLVALRELIAHCRSR